MAIPEAATYHPLSDAHFTPTLAYYIQPTKSSTKPVLNLTTQLLPLPDPSTSAPPTFIPEDVLARAKSIATCSTAAQTLIYVLHKDNLLGTHYTAQDRDGIQIAESQGGIIDWGRTTFKFPDGSQHGEGFEMKTVAFGRKAKVLSPLLYDSAPLQPLPIPNLRLDNFK
jgi:hypothetical protein